MPSVAAPVFALWRLPLCRIRDNSPMEHPRTRIKVCGFTREQDIDAAVEAGVDAAGFVLYAPSPRAVTPQRAAELARRLPPFVTPVPVATLISTMTPGMGALIE